MSTFPQNTVVKVQDVCKEYKEVKALKNISFTVSKGEIFGVLGPDGAGKTSLFRILTSLLLPTSGNAWLLNKNCASDYKEIRKIIGYMPGRFSLYQDLSVEENLKFFATVFGTTIEENYDLVKDIYSQIEPFKARLAGRLSGGMKQKLALSCALIHKPEILILDEPTTGVDAVSRKEFWEMLQKLKDNGITILVSTPYMDEASLCDRVMLIQKGETMNLAPPEEIIKSFPHELYAIRAQNMYQLKKILMEYPHTNTVFLFGQFLHYTDKRNDFEADLLINHLKNNGCENVSITKITPNIEDCFINLM